MLSWVEHEKPFATSEPGLINWIPLLLALKHLYLEKLPFPSDI